MSTLELENQQVPGVQEAADSAEAAKKAAVEAVAEASRANDNAERAIDAAEEATKVAKDATGKLEENIDKIEEAYTTANEAKEAVAVEKTQREADRDALQTNINLEVMAREKDRDNLQKNINAEVAARTAADDSLRSEIDDLTSKSGDIETDIANLKQKDTDIENDVATLRTDMTNADTATNERIDTLQSTVNEHGENAFVDNMSVDGNESTVSLQYSKKKVNGGTSSSPTPIELPVADATQAGVMSPAMYNSLQETAEKVDTLTNAVVAINDLPAEPTQEQLTDAWKEATGKTELVNCAKIYDSANDKQWTYYSNLDEWKPAAAGGATVTVEQFTNTEAGVIKGSTNKYQVFAEADGTGSVNGLDALETSVSTNTSDITQLKEDMETEHTRTQNLPAQVVYSSSLTDYNADKVATAMVVKDLHTGGDATIPMEINGATTTQAGVMTTAQVEQLNTNTSDITNIKTKNTEQDTAISNNTTKIAENAAQIQTVTDDVSEAMGDVAAIQADYVSKAGLLNAYSTATDNTNSASFIKQKLDSSSLALGRATARGSESVALGSGAASTDHYSVAIGKNAIVELNPSSANSFSVALGSHAKAKRNEEVSIGNPDNAAHKTRYLANVKAGELDTDAVNKKQMEDYVAEHSGGSGESITRVALTVDGAYLVPPTDITAEKLKSGELFMLIFPESTAQSFSWRIKATKEDGAAEYITIYQPTVKGEASDTEWVVKNGFMLVYYGQTKNYQGNNVYGLIASAGSREEINPEPPVYRVTKYTGSDTSSLYTYLEFENKGFSPYTYDTGYLHDFYIICDQDIATNGKTPAIRVVQGDQLYSIPLEFMSKDGKLTALPSIKSKFAYHLYCVPYVRNPGSEYPDYTYHWVTDSFPFDPFESREWELLKIDTIDSGGIAAATNYQFKTQGYGIDWASYRRFKIVFDGYTANGSHSNQLIVYGNDNEWDPDVKVDAKWWGQVLFNINSAGTTTPTSAHVYNDNRGLYVSNHPARTIGVQQRFYGEFIWCPTSGYKMLSGYMDVSGVNGQANTIWHLDGHCTTNDTRAWPSVFNTLNFSFSYGDGSKITVYGSKY